VELPGACVVLPIVLDPTKLRVGIAGGGDALERRRHTLAAAGIRPEQIEGEDDLWSFDLLFIAGLTLERARVLAQAARAVGVLVNVEDVPDLCDFHIPAIVRRGDLLLTVSTNGRAPGLARAVRARLEREFGNEWNDRTREIAHLRGRWRWQGLPPQQVSALIAAHLAERGWLA
jgi:precorrin-2 dehydrogenase / sirohydrochlorin ferrochelatase